MTRGAVPGAQGPARRLTVELAGLPGSGKSRLTDFLSRDLVGRGVEVHVPRERLLTTAPPARRLMRKALTCGATVVRSPAATIRIGHAVLRSGQPTTADVAGRFVQVLLGQALLREAAGTTGVSILDEGLVQGLWSTGVRGDVEPLLAALDADRAAPLPDLLVVVRVRPEVAASRLARRSSRNSRTQLLVADERLAELSRGARLLDRLVDWFRTRAGGAAQVVVVGAEEDGDHRERLLEQICARLR